MCVAILTKPGFRVADEKLHAGWMSNRDGGGFAYVDPEQGKVVIKKGFLDFDAFLKAYVEHFERFGNDNPMLVHFRIRTSGATNANNTHPFQIKGGALVHNGIMFTPTGDDVGTPEDRKSDTRVFSERLFNILNYDDVSAGKDELGDVIGFGNKIAFLYDDGKYVIVNEKRGVWEDDGIWYSNAHSCRVSTGWRGGSSSSTTTSANNLK